MNNSRNAIPRAGTKTRFTVKEGIAHLQSRTIITDDGCHEWQGPRTKDGYGQLGSYWLFEQFGIKLTHRLMLHLVTGHVFTSRDEQVMHSCHNRACCNPEHLSIGTAYENIRQARERGSYDNAKCARPGETNNTAKLTDEQVRDIRARRAAGERGVDLAAEYGVTTSTISVIKRRKTWRHID